MASKNMAVLNLQPIWALIKGCGCSLFHFFSPLLMSFTSCTEFGSSTSLGRFLSAAAAQAPPIITAELHVSTPRLMSQLAGAASSDLPG